MRLFKREAEGALTVADWDDGFVGLSRNEESKNAIHVQFERWPCCPGSFELNIELFGMIFVIYNEGGPCQLEAYLSDETEPELEMASPVRTAVPANGSDWRSVPSPAAR